MNYGMNYATMRVLEKYPEIAMSQMGAKDEYMSSERRRIAAETATEQAAETELSGRLTEDDHLGDAREDRKNWRRMLSVFKWMLSSLRRRERDC